MQLTEVLQSGLPGAIVHYHVERAVSQGQGHARTQYPSLAVTNVWGSLMNHRIAIRSFAQVRIVYVLIIIILKQFNLCTMYIVYVHTDDYLRAHSDIHTLLEMLHGYWSTSSQE